MLHQTGFRKFHKNFSGGNFDTRMGPTDPIPRGWCSLRKCRDCTGTPPLRTRNPPLRAP
jgi:hypothetical protein